MSGLPLIPLLSPDCRKIINAQNALTMTQKPCDRADMRVARVILTCGIFASAAWGQCDLRISQAGPCLGDGTPGTPAVGDIYGLRVTVAVQGTPTAPFRIKWTIANRTIYYDNISVGPGSGYWWTMLIWMSLDGPIPWSVTLDPDNVAGDTDLANNTVSGVFEPIVPERAVELYAPRTLFGVLSATEQYGNRSGTIDLYSKLFGVPSTHGTQQALSFEAPAGGVFVTTEPYGRVIYEIIRRNAAAGTYTDTSKFRVRAHNMRVNPTLLRGATWEALAAEGPEWSIWTEPDDWCQSESPEVAGFVARSLPENYRSSLTPYDAARKLHMAVAKELRYLSPPTAGDAVGVLREKTADCGGFTTLLVAALRHIGIPSRGIGGFWQGSSQWHVRVEFHLPRVEWIVADPTSSDGDDANGDYAHHFGQIFDGNRFATMDVGFKHVRDYLTFGNLQVPNWYWNGGLELLLRDGFSRLQPLSTVEATPSDSQVTIKVDDVPTAGTMVIESSADLKTWQQEASEPARGDNRTLTVPKRGNSAFYRARLILD